MFYGSGAGKLPTASAVVADVVDAARHLNRTVMTFWSSKKIELTSMENAECRFFVRMANDKLETVKSIFGNVEIIRIADAEDEFGFVTEVMTEKEFAVKTASVGEVLNRIRLKG